VRVHSLTLSFTPKLLLLARNLASPCLGREPKAKVTTLIIEFNFGKPILNHASFAHIGPLEVLIDS
jgi:hypothetical protein